jgi:hypothetical protein
LRWLVKLVLKSAYPAKCTSGEQSIYRHVGTSTESRGEKRLHNIWHS